MVLQAYQKHTGFEARGTKDADSEAPGVIEFHLEKSGLEAVLQPLQDKAAKGFTSQLHTEEMQPQAAKSTTNVDSGDAQSVSQGSWSIPSQPAVA